jgi:hypothetical protein
VFNNVFLVATGSLKIEVLSDVFLLVLVCVFSLVVENNVLFIGLLDKLNIFGSVNLDVLRFELIGSVDLSLVDFKLRLFVGSFEVRNRFSKIMFCPLSVVLKANGQQENKDPNKIKKNKFILGCFCFLFVMIFL